MIFQLQPKTYLLKAGFFYTNGPSRYLILSILLDLFIIFALYNLVHQIWFISSININITASSILISVLCYLISSILLPYGWNSIKITETHISINSMKNIFKLIPTIKRFERVKKTEIHYNVITDTLTFFQSHNYKAGLCMNMLKKGPKTEFIDTIKRITSNDPDIVFIST